MSKASLSRLSRAGEETARQEAVEPSRREANEARRQAEKASLSRLSRAGEETARQEAVERSRREANEARRQAEKASLSRLSQTLLQVRQPRGVSFGCNTVHKYDPTQPIVRGLPQNETRENDDSQCLVCGKSDYSSSQNTVVCPSCCNATCIHCSKLYFSKSRKTNVCPGCREQ